MARVPIALIVHESVPAKTLREFVDYAKANPGKVNFGETLGNPWIDDIVYRDPVHASVLMNAKTGEAKGLKTGDFVELESPYGRIMGRVSLTQGVHPETVAVSNSLSRMALQHSGVHPGGGHFNELLPANLKSTGACSSQLETVARVKVRRIDVAPQDPPKGSLFSDRRVH